MKSGGKHAQNIEHINVSKITMERTMKTMLTNINMKTTFKNDQ